MPKTIVSAATTIASSTGSSAGSSTGSSAARDEGVPAEGTSDGGALEGALGLPEPAAPTVEPAEGRASLPIPPPSAARASGPLPAESSPRRSERRRGAGRSERRRHADGHARGSSAGRRFNSRHRG